MVEKEKKNLVTKRRRDDDELKQALLRFGINSSSNYGVRGVRELRIGNYVRRKKCPLTINYYFIHDQQREWFVFFKNTVISFCHPRGFSYNLSM